MAQGGRQDDPSPAQGASRVGEPHSDSLYSKLGKEHPLSDRQTDRTHGLCGWHLCKINWWQEVSGSLLSRLLK